MTERLYVTSRIPTGRKPVGRGARARPERKSVVSGRCHVGIANVEPVGHYAIRIIFDDLVTPEFFRGLICTSWAQNIMSVGKRTYQPSTVQVLAENLIACSDRCIKPHLKWFSRARRGKSQPTP